MATPHHETLTAQKVPRDPVAGLLKVWALDAKYILRGVPGVEVQVRKFGQRALGTELPDGRFLLYPPHRLCPCADCQDAIRLFDEGRL